MIIKRFDEIVANAEKSTHNETMDEADEIEKVDDVDIPFKEQLKKFAIKSLIGFQTVIVYGLGRRLGIFDYLDAKVKKMKDEKNQSISNVVFTPQELQENLRLDPYYLDGWLTMCVQLDLFRVHNTEKSELITAPHVVKLLISRDSSIYMGNIIGGFYYLAPYQDEILSNFKKGLFKDYFSLPEDIKKDGNAMSAYMGTKVEAVFSRKCKNLRKRLRSGGRLLEVGCGYGLNIEYWASKYRRSEMVGIDIDEDAVKGAQELMLSKSLSERISIYGLSVSEFAQKRLNDEKFDVILLNQVLHETPVGNNYREKLFNYLYELLKDDGMVVVGENLIPNLFDSKGKRDLFEVQHKWFEVLLGSRFYNIESFKEFIDETKFTRAELVKKKNDYFISVEK